MNYDLYKKHKEYVIRTMEIWDLIHTLLFTVDAIRYLYRLMGDNDKNELNGFNTHINDVLNPLINSFNNSLDIFNIQYNYLVDIYNKNTMIIIKQY